MPDGLAGLQHRDFVSGSFATNAIGSLIVDPNDRHAWAQRLAATVAGEG